MREQWRCETCGLHFWPDELLAIDDDPSNGFECLSCVNSQLRIAANEALGLTFDDYEDTE